MTAGHLAELMIEVYLTLKWLHSIYQTDVYADFVLYFKKGALRMEVCLCASEESLPRFRWP